MHIDAYICNKHSNQCKSVAAQTKTHTQTHYMQSTQPANNSELSQSQQMKEVYLYAQEPIRFPQNHERWENFMSCDQMQLYASCCQSIRQRLSWHQLQLIWSWLDAISCELAFLSVFDKVAQTCYKQWAIHCSMLNNILSNNYYNDPSIPSQHWKRHQQPRHQWTKSAMY